MLRLMNPPPNLIAQKLSPEALIHSVRKVETKDPSRLLAEECTGFVVADELATFLNKKSYEAGLASILIQMYDCKDRFKYNTISRGEEPVENACLGMLAGSTVDWIRSGIPEEAVGGGLTSRILFVYVEQPAAPVPFPVWTQAHEALHGKLIRQLTALSTTRGEFTLTPEAMEFYGHEYNEWWVKTGKDFQTDKALSGYFARRHAHLLKLAIVLSAAESMDRSIKKNHVFAAKVMLGDNEKFLKHVISLITSSNNGSEMSALVNYVKSRRTVTRSDLMRAMSSRMSSRQMSEFLDTLVLSGQLVIDVGENGTTVYRHVG